MSKSKVNWRDMLAGALEANSHLPYAKFFQIATVRPDGTPACRTVVFRGFMDGTSAITFYSDTRTEKVSEVARCAAAEACWYFEDSREQFRLAGQLTVVTGACTDSQLAEARKRLWGELSSGARQMLTFPQPAAPRADADEFKRDAPSGDDEPRSNFALVVLEVEHVDYVELFKNERMTFAKGEDGVWSEQGVNP